MNAIRTDYFDGFDKSSEIPLSKRLQKAKETGLKHFKEKAKGSMNLRREYELILTNKMEKKALSLRHDYNRFDRSWTGAWRVEAN